MLPNGGAILRHEVFELVERREVFWMPKYGLDDVIAGFLREKLMCPPLFLDGQNIITAKWICCAAARVCGLPHDCSYVSVLVPPM